MTEEDARRVVVALLATRAPEATVCPSEVARALVATRDTSGRSEEWRGAMPIVQAAVDGLLAEGQVWLSWKGNPLETRTGPYRIARRQVCAT